MLSGFNFLLEFVVSILHVLALRLYAGRLLNLGNFGCLNLYWSLLASIHFPLRVLIRSESVLGLDQLNVEEVLELVID